MRYAGVGPRAAAVILDGLTVVVALGLPVALVSGRAYHGGGRSGFNLHGWPAVAWLVVSLAYWVVLERVWGTTPGKRAMNLEVVDTGGRQISWGQSAGRNLLRLADAAPYVLPSLLGAIAVWSSDESCRLGDLAAGTRVVYRS